jgi:hypothetical protein
MADVEAIKRALANLVDNAAEAMQGALVREIQISTTLVGSRDAVEITVADTGHGVTQELKEALPALLLHQEARDWTGPGHRQAALSKTTAAPFGSRKISRSAPASWWSCRSPRKVFPLPPARQHA